MRLRPTAVASVSCLAIVLVASAPRADRATLDAEAVRAFLIEGYEANKQMDVDFVRAVPDSALRWAPNGDVRDFMQQIDHTANNTWAVPGAAYRPTLGDTAVYLNDREAMVEVVTREYDRVIASIRALPAADFGTEVDFFGQATPKWRVYMQGLQHTNWTRGQLVPYYHAHDVPVPRFILY